MTHLPRGAGDGSGRSSGSANAIADTTLANIITFERGEPLVNVVGVELVKPSGGQSPLLR